LIKTLGVSEAAGSDAAIGAQVSVRPGEFIAFEIVIGDLLAVSANWLAGSRRARMRIPGNSLPDFSLGESLGELGVVKLAAQFFKCNSLDGRGAFTHA